MARVAPVITNVHGVKFTQSEAKTFLNRLKSYNNRVERNYRRWIKAGMTPEQARSVAGETVSLSLDIFTSKSGIKAQLGAMTRKATTAYTVNRKENMISNIRIILRDRLGLTYDELDTIQDALNGLTLTQYMRWWEENKDLVELIFDESENVGTFMVTEAYVNGVKTRFNASLGISI